MLHVGQASRPVGSGMRRVTELPDPYERGLHEARKLNDRPLAGFGDDLCTWTRGDLSL